MQHDAGKAPTSLQVCPRARRMHGWKKNTPIVSMPTRSERGLVANMSKQ